MKPLLSILIPVAPNREKRLAAVLSRLQLNSIRFPDHTFEVVVVDGGATDKTQELCITFAKHIKLKYIYCPISRFICAAYPRNLGLRVCEGEIIGMIDIDHWPSENIVYGMLAPFINDDEFRFIFEDKNGKIKDWDKQIVAPIDIINRGYVIDSSKSKRYRDKIVLEKLNDHLLIDGLGYEILDAYREAQIKPPGTNSTLWSWAIKRQHAVLLNGYDEIYCRKFAYSREDDDWRQRLLAQGLQFFDGQHEKFCAIHLWHPAACRKNASNEINKEYFRNVCGQGIQNIIGAKKQCKNIVRNKKHNWGKLLKYSFSIINSVAREIVDHEKWIEENVSDMPSYPTKKPYDDAKGFINFLETLV